MSAPGLTVTLVIHSHRQAARLSRLLARLSPDALVVSEGTWTGGGEVAMAPGEPRRLPAFAPQVPAVPAPNLRGAIAEIAAEVPKWLQSRDEGRKVPWCILEARGTEAQARWQALQAVSTDAAVILDPFDSVDATWWAAVVEMLAMHPFVGAVVAPVVAEWWGGAVRDAACSYRTVAVRTARTLGVRALGNGVEYPVRGATAHAALPEIRRDVMAQWETASVVAAQVAAARGDEGEALREVFEQQWERVESADPESRSPEAARAILSAGRAWASLTRGPVPMFVWRDGTFVSEGSARG